MAWISSPPNEYTQYPSGDMFAYIHKTTTISCNLTIGRNSYVAENSFLGGKYPITIGSFCSLAPNIYCMTFDSHDFTHITTSPMNTLLGMKLNYSEINEKPQGVKIGNDVYVGEGVRLMAGVIIGDGAVVGARALVTKELLPYGVYGGIPARLIKYRYSHEVIDFLESLQWWSWPKEKILRNAIFFNMAPNIVSLKELQDSVVE
jgi:virginiamycin A acetyltransferase